VPDTEIMEISLSGSDPEQAGIVNAIKNAYFEEVVNIELRRRSDRHAKLKRIKQTYADMLKERRDTIRKLIGFGRGERGAVPGLGKE
jgi:hypothetical protein